MQHSKDNFRHESLQDSKTIQSILKAITKGLAKGELTFNDEDGEIVMHPNGLLNLKVTATQDEFKHRLNIRITWQSEDKTEHKRPLAVNSTDSK
ncbi:amphi-Trp domain-containing protein [Thiohalophilus sp.]|uniref:amphi-Trp domain-containing protein n=1 Tax=Thiohalophilus sp. TaxID=3028392 RepID=UPI0039761BA3